jgi:hypothetical protein
MAKRDNHLDNNESGKSGEINIKSFLIILHENSFYVIANDKYSIHLKPKKHSKNLNNP